MEKGKGLERLDDSNKEALSPQMDVLRQITSERKQQESQSLNRTRSHPRLVEHYQFLLRSAHFQQLDQAANSEQSLRLRDSTHLSGENAIYAGKTLYDVNTHRIFIPLDTKDVSTKDVTPRPLARVREELLWEMQLASSRDQAGRALKLRPSALGPDSSHEEKEIYSYKMAAYALSTEWTEWANLAMHNRRVYAINKDPNMGEGGPHVTRAFEKHYAEFDQGWYKFTNYLEEQIKTKHTTQYDPDALKHNWVGKDILAVAQEMSSAHFIITQRDIQNWQSGETVTFFLNNPFNSSTIIEQARQRSLKKGVQ